MGPAGLGDSRPPAGSRGKTTVGSLGIKSPRSQSISPKYIYIILSTHGRKFNKCVSKTDTNSPFAFQIAFPRGTDFTGFLQGGSKIRDLLSEISVRIES